MDASIYSLWNILTPSAPWLINCSAMLSDKLLNLSNDNNCDFTKRSQLSRSGENCRKCCA